MAESVRGDDALLVVVGRQADDDDERVVGDAGVVVRRVDGQIATHSLPIERFANILARTRQPINATVSCSCLARLLISERFLTYSFAFVGFLLLDRLAVAMPLLIIPISNMWMSQSGRIKFLVNFLNVSVC